MRSTIICCDVCWRQHHSNTRTPTTHLHLLNNCLPRCGRPGKYSLTKMMLVIIYPQNTWACCNLGFMLKYSIIWRCRDVLCLSILWLIDVDETLQEKELSLNFILLVTVIYLYCFLPIKCSVIIYIYVFLLF